MTLIDITDSESFKMKAKIAGTTPAAGHTKDVKIAQPLNQLSKFWRTLEMPVIKCEKNHLLTGSENWVSSHQLYLKCNGQSNEKFRVSHSQ